MGPLTGSQGAKRLPQALQVSSMVTTYDHRDRTSGGTHLLGRKEVAQDSPTLDEGPFKVGAVAFPKLNPPSNPLE
jgi:hypothetical protein